jgi:RNA polymerase sigma-70 factor (ECF subfamily)
MTLELTDELLLGRMLKGDEAAFTALYRRRQAGVYRYALQMCGSVEVAEEITQDVFLVLMREGRKFDAARGSVAAFLCGVARNFVRRHLERSRAEAWVEFEGEGQDPVADERASALDHLTRRETVSAVRRAILSLPPAYREVVVLCELQEMSYQDAAAVLECPIGTVRSRLSRARGLLLEKFRGVPMMVAAVKGAAL